MNDQLTLYLLTIRGTLSPTTLEEARKIHNMTAGNPEGVAAAKSLGDVSHMVYIPMPHDGHAASNGAGEFLIMDLWYSIDGLNTFFSDHQVQEGGNMIFSQRDPVVWAPAEASPASTSRRRSETMTGSLQWCAALLIPKLKRNSCITLPCPKRSARPVS